MTEELRAYAREKVAPRLVKELLALSEEERDEVFLVLRDAFCVSCGAAKTPERPNCFCMRDE